MDITETETETETESRSGTKSRASRRSKRSKRLELLGVYYELQLKDIIAKYTYNNRITTYSSYVSNISNLITTRNPSSVRLVSDYYFLKSFFGLLMKNYFREYKAIDDGKLKENSANCKFTISLIDDKKVFIKTINYSKVKERKTDNPIFDCISGFIFNKIIEKEPDLSKFIAKYKYSFLSYTNRNIWNYNHLNPNMELSPYNKNKIDNDDLPMEYDKNIIYMSDAVESGLSIDEIFVKFIRSPSENKALVHEIIMNSVEFFKFLKYMGITYGFIHNDLHFGNILYDPDNHTFVLIDLGRTCFARYLYTEDDEEINNYIQSEFYKLNMNDVIPNPINNYIELYYNNPKLFRFMIPYPFQNNKYYTYTIFDLITFTFNIYVKFLIYTDLSRHPDYSLFIRELSKILKIYIDYSLTSNIQINSNKFSYKITVKSIKELLKVYKEINKVFLKPIFDSHSYDKIYDVFKMILDGLVIIALLFLYKESVDEVINNNYRSLDFIHRYFQVKLTQEDAYKFILFIFEKIIRNNTYNKILMRFNHPLTQIFPVVSGYMATKGGLFDTSKNKNEVELQSLSKSLSLSSNSSMPALEYESISKSRSNSKSKTKDITMSNYEKLFKVKKDADLPYE